MPEKVLILDDDLTVNVIVSKTLGKAGFESRTAFTAEEALARVGQEKFDLIICDLKMPKQDGIEFLKRLNELGIADTVPIIILSGHLEQLGRQAQNLGATDLVAKPFDPAELVLRARRAIERGPRAAMSQRWVKSEKTPAGGIAMTPLSSLPLGTPPPTFTPAPPSPAEARSPPAEPRPLLMPAEAAPPPPAPAPPSGNGAAAAATTRRVRDQRFGGKLAQEIAPPSTERPDCVGTLEHIQVAELVRFLFLARRSGLIEATHDEERGEIVIREGEVVRAAVYLGTQEAQRALVALRQILGWRAGRFRIAFCDVGLGPTLPKSTAALLTEAFGGSIDYSKIRSGPT